MFKFKYPVDFAKADLAPTENAPYYRFDLERLNPQGLVATVIAAVKGVAIPLTLSILQRVAPRLQIGRLLILTRHDDIVHVLKNDRAFAVPFNVEMTRLAGGATFMLGLDGATHACQREPVEKMIDPARVADLTAHAATVSKALLDNSGGRIDVMRDYFARVSTECVCRLLGMEPEDPDRFSEWTFPVSARLFGDPWGDPVIAELSEHAAWRLRGVADQAIARAKEAAEAEGSAAANPAPPPSLVTSLLSPGGREWTDEELRALMIGIATGATPTMTLLAGNIFDWLLKRPDRWDDALAAAAEPPPAEGPPQLLKLLREASRFAPALDPGQFRLAKSGARLPARGKFPKPDREVAPNTVVLAATAVALRDRKTYFRPNKFDPDRPQLDEHLAFGSEPHRCLGRAIAEGQLEAMFRALLTQPGLKRAPGRAGRMHRIGPFPERIELEFTVPGRPAGNAMVTMLVPAPGAVHGGREAIEASLKKLDGDPRWRTALGATGIVHFASLSLIDCPAKGQPTPQLLFELSCDGSWSDCLAAVEREASDLLAPVFAAAGTPASRSGLARHLAYYRIDVRRWPWGATGLNFNGGPDFSVAGKANARAIARYATRALDLYLRINPRNRAGRPLDVLVFVRRLMLEDPAKVVPAMRRLPRAWHNDLKLENLRQHGWSLRAALWRPGRQTLPWTGWTGLSSVAVLRSFVTSRDALPLYALVAGVALAIGGMTFWALRSVPYGLPGILLLVLASMLVLTVFVLGVVLWRFWAALRRLEESDWPDARDPPQGWVDRVAAGENRLDHVQNHFISLSLLKPGIVRRLTLALAMWGIEMLLKHGFPPGFASDIGTIHTARWVRLARSNQLLFTANYDGSWESYLEDFVTLAHEGQTAAWSNSQGFPPTRRLIGGGAEDGDRFKRWVRLQQQPTGAWYSRFPNFTMDRIRRDAEIAHGLAHASTDDDARRWLALFGSAPPPAEMVDLDEVQTIVLTGQKDLAHGVSLLISLPGGEDEPDVDRRHRLLNALVQGRRPGDGSGIAGALPPLSFGLPAAAASDAGPVQPAEVSAWLAFSATGLQKIGFSEETMGSFDLPFQAGMEARSELLRLDNARWAWSDKTVDVALTILATKARIAEVKADAVKAIESALGTIVAQIDLAPVEGQVEREPFGFIDGISQPVLRGVRTDLARANPDDVVAPGEILLGHRGNDGNVASPPRLQAERDPLGLLPDAMPTANGAVSAFRDLGRNGSMVAIQQFTQNVRGFEDFCKQEAKRLAAEYKFVFEQAPTAEWVAARFVGRWKDGTPLVDRPSAPGGAPSNSFGYAKDDPMGHRCPLGAHIRRANPRDALAPPGPGARERSNRHRILRRGRAWFDGDDSQGLLFVGLCGSLERQFEFVQRSWIAAPSFAALEGEADPILGPHVKPNTPVPEAERDLSRVFTIPTAKGPVRVTGMQSFVNQIGGGYFFLPGRAALDFMLWRHRGKARQVR